MLKNGLQLMAFGYVAGLVNFYGPPLFAGSLISLVASVSMIAGISLSAFALLRKLVLVVDGA
ncbi:MAG: hypothetical protein WBG92_06325 [Thiohalocapsa sp.]